jgi:hypothetical protein
LKSSHTGPFGLSLRKEHYWETRRTKQYWDTSRIESLLLSIFRIIGDRTSLAEHAD